VLTRPNIKNKSDTTFCINLYSYNTFDTAIQSGIVGVIKTTNDTVFFVNSFGNNFLINSKDSCTLEVSADCLDFSSFEYSKYNECGDNTDMMLSLIRDMEFYYIPVIKGIPKNNNNYCIGLSAKTKIISHSKIR
jgi:hypothetical protein